MRRRSSLLGVVAAAALASATWVAAAPSASGDPGQVPNVTICHRTNSNTNPYVKITVDESAVDGDSGNDHGQGDHLLEHTGPVWNPTLKAQHIEWGDIIPPFDVNGDPRPNTNLTLNWPAGQAIFENGCKPVTPPEQEFGSLHVTKVVNGAVSGNPIPTEFTVHVTCDDGVTDLDLTLPVGGGDQTVDNIEAGSTCTVVEQNTGTFSQGATWTYDPVGADSAGVGVDANATTEVTVTNTFPPPVLQPEIVTDPGTPVVAPVVAPAAVQVTPKTTG